MWTPGAGKEEKEKEKRRAAIPQKSKEHPEQEDSKETEWKTELV